MSEFFGNYGFFILITLTMLICHLGHGGHGRHGRRKEGREDADADERSSTHRH